MNVSSEALLPPDDQSSRSNPSNGESSDPELDEKNENILNASMNENLKTELVKLDKSKCVDLLIQKFRDFYKNHLSQEMYHDMVSKCIELKAACINGLSETIKNT